MNARQCGQFIGCPQEISISQMSKWLILVNKTSELFFQVGTNRLSIIKIDNTCPECQIVKMTALGSDYESCLHLFDRNYATFFLMLQLRVTNPND